MTQLKTVAVVVILLVGSLLMAQEKTQQPKVYGRVPQGWTRLLSLTKEQQKTLRDKDKAYRLKLAEIRELHQKDLISVLTDSQKKTLLRSMGLDESKKASK